MQRSGNFQRLDAEAQIRRAGRIGLDRINVSAGPPYRERPGQMGQGRDRPIAVQSKRRRERKRMSGKRCHRIERDAVECALRRQVAVVV